MAIKTKVEATITSSGLMTGNLPSFPEHRKFVQKLMQEFTSKTREAILKNSVTNEKEICKLVNAMFKEICKKHFKEHRRKKSVL